MKYLDRRDLIEIGVIFLIVVVSLLALANLIFAVYFIIRNIPPGCVPHVTI